MTEQRTRRARRVARWVLVTAIVGVVTMVATLAPTVDRPAPAAATEATSAANAVVCPELLCPPPPDGTPTQGSIFPTLSGQYAATALQQAALTRLQQAAVAAIIEQHGLDPRDGPAVMTWARPQVRARMWTDIVALIGLPPAERTTDQQLVYDWLAGVVQKQAINAATEAVRQFNLWAGAPDGTTAAWRGDIGLGDRTPGGGWSGNKGMCGFRAPAPFEGEYTGYNSQYCFGIGCTTPGACTNLPYPSYESLVKWGNQVAYGSKAGSADIALISAETAKAIGLFAAATGGTIATTLALSRLSSATLDKIVGAIAPYIVRAIHKGAEAGLGAARLAYLVGFANVALIIIIAIVTAVLEGIRVIDIENLPGKLDALVAGARASVPDLAGYIATTEGETGLFTTFMGATSPEYDGPGPLPAGGAGDWLVEVGPTGNPTTRANAFVHDGGDAGKSYETTLQGGWFVHRHVDPTTGQTVTVPSLSLHSTDPDGTPVTYHRVKDTDGTPTFIVIDDEAVNASATPSCTTGAPTCRETKEILYSAPGGARGTATLIPNDAPAIAGVTITGTPAEGATLQLHADATDLDGPLTYDWTLPVVWGEEPFRSGPDVSWTVRRSGPLNVELRVTDRWGKRSSFTRVVAVDNVGPQVSLQSPPDVFNPWYGAVEGSRFELTGRVVDPGVGAHAFRVVWGDGTTSDVSWQHPLGPIRCTPAQLPGQPPQVPDANCIDLIPDATGADAILRHQYEDDSGGDLWTITATDSDGVEQDAASVWVRVHNAAPVIDGLNIPSGPAGELVTLGGLVHDPGRLDTMTAHIDWGDGSPVQEVPLPAGSTQLTRDHLYPDGVDHYTIVVTLEDDDGGTTTAMTSAHIGPAVPVADAGPDRDVDEGAEVTLDARGTTTHNALPLSYSWLQVGGPAVTLTNPNTATPRFVAPPAPATLTFEVIAYDEFAAANQALIGRDQVTLTVRDVNHMPVVDAGPDQAVDELTTATLGASGTDPDGDPLTYSWTQTAGPAVTLTGADTAAPTFTVPEAPAASTFRVTASDGHGGTATDDVTITARDVNRIPVADAGPAGTVASESDVALDATGSTDPDGDALTYAWTQTAGPAVTLSGGTTAEPTFAAPAGPATLTFAVTVDDGRGGTASDDVTITVLARDLTASERYVVEVFSTFLHRTPDAAGLAYWSSALDDGASRHSVARRIGFSTEANHVLVADRFHTWLGRPARADDRAYWAQRLSAGLPLATFERAVLASPEMRTRAGGTDTAYVTALYQALLGRPPDAGGLAFWSTRLTRGASRPSVADALMWSPEARRHRVVATFEEVVGQAPSPAQLGIYVPLLGATRDIRQVAISVIAALGVRAR